MTSKDSISVRELEELPTKHLADGRWFVKPHQGEDMHPYDFNTTRIHSLGGSDKAVSGRLTWNFVSCGRGDCDPHEF